MPAGQMISRFMTMDLLVHTWDLARAVGADERLDEDAGRNTSQRAAEPRHPGSRRPARPHWPESRAAHAQASRL